MLKSESDHTIWEMLKIESESNIPICKILEIDNTATFKKYSKVKVTI